MFFILKLKKISCVPFKIKLKAWKASYFLIILNGEKRKLRQNMMVTFVPWIFFIRLKQKNKLESHKNLCENKDFWNIVISSEYTKILEFYQYQKSD